MKFKGIEYEALNPIYQNLIELVGYECAEKLYDHYRGQQLNFPIRLFNTEYIKKTLVAQGDSCDIKKLSRELGCSERWVIKLAKDGDGPKLC